MNVTLEEKLAIAIDGPAAAGKSTVAKRVAQKLSYIYIDTGAMYRALTFKAINEGIPLNDEFTLVDLLEGTEINLIQSPDGQQVFVDGVDVTLEIRSQKVTNNVSQIAKLPRIRKIMVKRQQSFAKRRGIVMDGRDIGTHVLPDAEVKVFLIASVEERAKRRHVENSKQGFSSNLNELKKEIEQRDLMDSKRETAPLIKADDAIEIDTTSMSIQEVVESILMKVKKIKNN